MAKKMKAHPGFKAVAAKRQGISKGLGSAAATRKSSPAAKKSNLRLKRVKG